MNIDGKKERLPSQAIFLGLKPSGHDKIFFECTCQTPPSLGKLSCY